MWQTGILLFLYSMPLESVAACFYRTIPFAPCVKVVLANTHGQKLVFVCATEWLMTMTSKV
jgi:hypothetical protein